MKAIAYAVVSAGFINAAAQIVASGAWRGAEVTTLILAGISALALVAVVFSKSDK